MTLLATKGLKYSIDGFMAVAGVDLEVAKGELLAIIGPNGAGKTTLFNLISGFLAPVAGDVYFKGERITGLAPHRIVRKGISRAFQRANIFDAMTVLENVRMGVLADRRAASRFLCDADGMREVNDEALRILDRLGIEPLKDRAAGTIPHGLKKALEIGIALSLRADLLLLDEPTSGMNPEETRAFACLMEDVMSQETLAVAVVEHDMDLVFDLARRIVVMCEGRIVADGAPEAVRTDPLVREVYLGS